MGGWHGQLGGQCTGGGDTAEVGVHGSREAPARLALQGELVEAMPQPGGDDTGYYDADFQAFRENSVGDPACRASVKIDPNAGAVAAAPPQHAVGDPACRAIVKIDPKAGAVAAALPPTPFPNERKTPWLMRRCGKVGMVVYIVVCFLCLLGCMGIDSNAGALAAATANTHSEEKGAGAVKAAPASQPYEDKASTGASSAQLDASTLDSFGIAMKRNGLRVGMKVCLFFDKEVIAEVINQKEQPLPWRDRARGETRSEDHELEPWPCGP